MTNGAVALQAAFWLMVAAVALNYAGLYWILRLVAPRAPAARNPTPDRKLPTLSVIVPAYNEEAVLASKLDNLLGQDYPPDRREIIVASDASTDGTEAIAAAYADRGVKLEVFRQRQGKFSLIDAVVPRTTGEVVVVTDANVFAEPDALRRLAEEFQDDTVGAASGHLQLIPPRQGLNFEREIQYQRLETELKRDLGKMGAVIGVFGGFYAFRRVLFRPIGPKPCADDLIIPMEVLAQGYRVTFADRARAVEETLPTLEEAFRRRVRLMAYNLNALPRVVKLAWQAGPRVFALTLLYKLLRWASPYLLALLVPVTALLTWHGTFYRLAAMGLLAVLVLAGVGWMLDRQGTSTRLTSGACQMVMMNLAAVLGAWHWWRGVPPYWTPRGKG